MYIYTYTHTYIYIYIYIYIYMHPTKYYYGDQVKKKGMDYACCTQGGEEKCMQGCSGEI